MSSNELLEIFNKTCEKAKEIKSANNEQKLKIYGLFKVATEGAYTSEKDKEIGFFDYEKKYKYESWKRLSNLSKNEAMQEYIRFYYSLTKQEIPSNVKSIVDSSNKENTNENIFNSNELDMINQNMETGSHHTYSSTAKQAKEEIKIFLEKSSSEECVFFDLQSTFRDKKDICEKDLEKYKHIDCKSYLIF